MTDSLSDLATQHLPCGYCGAQPGQRCIARPSGRPAVYPHTGRLDLVLTAYQLGRLSGWESGLNAGKRQLRVAQLKAQGVTDSRIVWDRLRAEGL